LARATSAFSFGPSSNSGYCWLLATTLRNSKDIPESSDAKATTVKLRQRPVGLWPTGGGTPAPQLPFLHGAGTRGGQRHT
jgi:hypothetical protein